MKQAEPGCTHLLKDDENFGSRDVNRTISRFFRLSTTSVSKSQIENLLYLLHITGHDSTLRNIRYYASFHRFRLEDEEKQNKASQHAKKERGVTVEDRNT